MMDVKFYIPGNAVIPTSLKLIVDGRYIVTYEKAIADSNLPYGFAYDFTFRNNIANRKAVMDEIVSILYRQSYDHGVQWRETKRQVIRKVIDGRYGTIITERVYFKIRDAG